MATKRKRELDEFFADNMSNREFCAGGVHYIPVPLDAQEGNYEMEQELDENDSSDEVVPLDEIFHR